VAIKAEDHVYNLSDGPVLIGKTVHIADWDQLTKFASGQPVVLNIIPTPPQSTNTGPTFTSSMSIVCISILMTRDLIPGVEATTYFLGSC